MQKMCDMSHAILLSEGTLSSASERGWRCRFYVLIQTAAVPCRLIPSNDRQAAVVAAFISVEELQAATAAARKQTKVELRGRRPPHPPIRRGALALEEAGERGGGRRGGGRGRRGDGQEQQAECPLKEEDGVRHVAPHFEGRRNL